MRKIHDDLGWELSWDPNFVAGPDENDYDNLIGYALHIGGALLAARNSPTAIAKATPRAAETDPYGMQAI